MPKINIIILLGQIIPHVFKWKYHFSDILAKISNLNSVKKKYKPNWGTVYKIIGLHSSKCQCRESQIEGYLDSVQFSQSCPTLCDPMNCSTPGLPVRHRVPEFTQTHVHRVCDAIQPSHPWSSSSPPALNPSQHQGLFQWVNSSYEVAKLEFQL